MLAYFLYNLVNLILERLRFGHKHQQLIGGRRALTRPVSAKSAGVGFDAMRQFLRRKWRALKIS